MKVILTAEVESLGSKGDVVEVSDGYARNFLLPGKKAMAASAGAVVAATKAKVTREAATRRARE